jgi:hypothetical protein
MYEGCRARGLCAPAPVFVRACRSIRSVRRRSRFDPSPEGTSLERRGAGPRQGAPPAHGGGLPGARRHLRRRLGHRGCAAARGRGQPRASALGGRVREAHRGLSGPSILRQDHETPVEPRRGPARQRSPSSDRSGQAPMASSTTSPGGPPRADPSGRSSGVSNGTWLARSTGL